MYGDEMWRKYEYINGPAANLTVRLLWLLLVLLLTLPILTKIIVEFPHVPGGRKFQIHTQTWLERLLNFHTVIETKETMEEDGT